eukprot:14008380-Alexandrium_andersonii.AAC.1
MPAQLRLISATQPQLTNPAGFERTPPAINQHSLGRLRSQMTSATTSIALAKTPAATTTTTPPTTSPVTTTTTTTL